jgi:hypothetical protein
MNRLDQLAAILADGKEHTNLELVEKVGHRFGAQILQLRKGELNEDREQPCWVIEGKPVEGQVGVWKYRLVGFTETYQTEGHKCPNCGWKLTVHDVRQAT